MLIPIVDDDLDEAEDQTFVVRMRISSAVNQSNIITTREVTRVIIGDNDRKFGGREGVGWGGVGRRKLEVFW